MYISNILENLKDKIDNIPTYVGINKFDDEYNRILRKIITHGTWIFNKRTQKYCLTYFNDMMTFDLSNGSFPLLTTKKILVNPMIAELLGFIRAFDNSRQFVELGCNWWDANANKSKDWINNPNRHGIDHLGRIYGVQARKWQSFHFIKKTWVKKPSIPKPEIPKFDIIEPDYSINTHNLVGQILESKLSGKFKIIKEYNKKLEKKFRSYFDIQFLNTGYVSKRLQHHEIKSGKVKDPYSPRVFGVACSGLTKNNKLHNLLKHTWIDMIDRCYNDNNKYKNRYKDRNIFVCNRWLNFENFLEDFPKIPRWELKMEFPNDYSLDKDFYGYNYYSAETCRWSSKHEQTLNTENVIAFEAISPCGEKYLECGLSNFAKKYNLDAKKILGNRNTNKSINGWKFKEIYFDNNIKIRGSIIDQLGMCIAKIKHNPDDRRMVVSHWNPAELHMMALAPCHMMYFFDVINDNLMLSMTQRSADFPLGIPMNIASYALLLSVIAKITDKTPKIFGHIMNNIHIYEDQLPFVEEQLNREPFDPPKLIINEKIKSLKDLETWVTVDDFKFENYQHHPAIKYPFSE